MNRSGAFSSNVIECQGPMAQFCTALVAVQVSPQPGLDLTIIPHDSVVLSIQFAQGREPFSRSTDRGLLPELCTYRDLPLTYRPIGGCLSFLGLLTPRGAMALTAGQPLPCPDGPRRPLAQLLERSRLIELEDRMARSPDVHQQLEAFGAWIEDAVSTRTALPLQANRAARMASAIFSKPALTLQQVAALEGVRQRQMERDFNGWLAISPKQASLLARVQGAARLGVRGGALADVAHSLGFVDQSHMNKAVKRITGVSPRVLISSAQTEMS
ncbi:MAG: helix-turn-helix domain-containing protein, partial [Ramlibacter sp.]